MMGDSQPGLGSGLLGSKGDESPVDGVRASLPRQDDQQLRGVPGGCGEIHLLGRRDLRWVAQPGHGDHIDSLHVAGAG